MTDHFHPEHAPVPTQAYLKPHGAAEVAELIRNILQAYLREERPDFTEPIGDDMSFDYVGLDSLARVSLIDRLEKALGHSFDPTSAYDFVTVRALSEFVWSEISSPRHQHGTTTGGLNA